MIKNHPNRKIQVSSNGTLEPNRYFSLGFDVSHFPTEFQTEPSLRFCYYTTKEPKVISVNCVQPSKMKMVQN